MAKKIEDRTVPYEILVRFDEQGEVQGAHIQYRRLVTVGGETMKEEVGPAIPLSLAESDEQHATLKAVLGDAFAEAGSRIDALSRQVTDLETERDTLRVMLDRRRDVPVDVDALRATKNVA